ncbi:MAG: 30S ribosomal protein S11 [Bacteroidota bacterium]
MAKPQQRAKKKKVVVDQAGQAHIKATYNNVIISMTNGGGQVIAWSSAGKMGFKGSKKNTPYAAQISAADCAKAAYELGLRQIEVYVKGAGVGRDAAIRTLQDNGLEIMVIKDITPIPHNGCRPPKRRHP